MDVGQYFSGDPPFTGATAEVQGDSTKPEAIQLGGWGS